MLSEYMHWHRQSAIYDFLSHASVVWENSGSNPVNAFHRGLVTMSFFGVLSIFGARFMAWAAGVPIESYLPIDLMHFSCLGSAIALCFLPRFWLLLPALFASALAALHWPAHCFEIANISYTLLPLFFIASWSEVASRSTAAPPKEMASGATKT